MNPEAILEGLAQAARASVLLATAWHGALALTLLALLFGWRPSQRSAGLLLALPLASVAVTAARHQIWFNALVMGVGVVVLAGLALGMSAEPTRAGAAPVRVMGAALLALSWFYPHFTSSPHPLSYFYATPLGVLPCPTLASVVGFAIIARGFRSRAWSSVLAGLALFYGLFGTHVLGVFIDTFLTLGGLVLAGMAWSRRALPDHGGSRT